jgi:peptidoglycan/LPS O-acetylase OafA/YrhL
MKNQSALMITGGGAALAIGSFLAWGTVFGISINGIDGGDGWMTLFGGAVVAVYGFMAYQGKSSLPKWLPWAGLVVGLGVALINFFDILGTDGVSIGIGMYLMLAGGAVAIYGLLQKSENQATD